MTERTKPKIGGLASLLQAEKQKKLQAQQASESARPTETTAQQADNTETTPAGSSLPAQGTLTAQGNTSDLGDIPAQGILPAPSRLSALGSLSAQGKKSTPSRIPAQGRLTTRSEISPKRDFTKTPNSVVRDALRSGLFRGKSKQIYDFLYSKTRGAIIPRLSVQLTRTEIMKGSHVGSTHTLRDNLRHLKSVGLVKWEEKAGEQDGNEYFVYQPEEANLPFDFEGNPVLKFEADPGQVSCPDHPDHPGQKLPRVPRAETAQGAQGSSLIDSTISSDPNTSFKTIQKTDDDEDFALLVERIREAARELVGGTTQGERERWGEVGELLAAEMKKAASNAETVSSAPAFFAAHLRRRLNVKAFVKERETDAPKKQTDAQPVEPHPPAPEDEAEYKRIRAELEGRETPHQESPASEVPILSSGNQGSEAPSRQSTTLDEPDPLDDKTP
ncbi:MAG TPA: hypothetical protein VGB73_10045 [Pyrinomonadaceae bacterium]|jgi:hypothetical protein